MLKIEYHRTNGSCLPDGDVAEYVKSEINFWILRGKPDTHLTYSSEVIINEFRIHVGLGTIDKDEILFYYDGLEIRCNQFARMSEWPSGFCDTIDHQLMTILNFGLKK